MKKFLVFATVFAALPLAAQKSDKKPMTQQQGDETVVFSEITRNDGGKIHVEWHLINNGGWKISDAYVAGVSMKITQRDEFASVIQQGGGQIQYLLERLRQKVGG